MIKIPLLFQCLIRVVIQETIITRITAPMIEGTNAMPARLGPQLPNKLSPNYEPINPASILLIQPIAAPRLVSAPATAPIIAPTIKVQIIPIFYSPFASKIL